jgi:hypothetical protein
LSCLCDSAALIGVRIVGRQAHGLLKFGLCQLVFAAFEVDLASVVVDLGLPPVGELAIPRSITKAHQRHSKHTKGDDSQEDKGGQEPAPGKAAPASAFST